MNIYPSNEKIEKYLDELSDEYKELLFKALLSRSSSVDNLSVSELLRLDAEIKKPLLENYQRQQKRRKMLLVSGLTYMFLGLFMFVFFKVFNSDFIYNRDDIVSLMSVVIGFVGFIVSVLSFALPTIRTSSSKHAESNKGGDLSLLEYEVIAKWRELEGVVNDISINSDVKTPRSIIDFLAENQFIDNEEYRILKEFLKMRNNVVHSTDTNYSEKELKDTIAKIEKIIEKIKKIV